MDKGLYATILMLCVILLVLALFSERLTAASKVVELAQNGSLIFYKI
ncbi:MAG: hypothetical protein ABWK01_03185 [Infirmifilum sp.]